MQFSDCIGATQPVHWKSVVFPYARHPQTALMNINWKIIVFVSPRNSCILLDNSNTQSFFISFIACNLSSSAYFSTSPVNKTTEKRTLFFSNELAWNECRLHYTPAEPDIRSINDLSGVVARRGGSSFNNLGTWEPEILSPFVCCAPFPNLNTFGRPKSGLMKPPQSA